MEPSITKAIAIVACIALSIGSSAAAQNNAPEVTNVIASQRGDDSKLVDVHYDLADADSDPCTVWVSVSQDDGATWRVPAKTFTGDIGQDVTPGTNKTVVWDAGADMSGRQGNFKVRVWPDDGNGPAPMVLVPGGWFPYQNVSNPEDWIYVDTFLIDKYEVTNAFYVQFLNHGGNDDHWDAGQEIDRTGSAGNYVYEVQAGKADYPIRHVNYYDAVDFATWRSSQSGQTYRLPSAHEWEKAAAWDPVASHYYTYGFHRDTIDCDWCNYRPSGYCIGNTTPVGYYDGTGGRENAKSHYGCYDMSGNVYEWTSEQVSTYRVLRGGGWDNLAAYCRCTYRGSGTPSNRGSSSGFRLVLDLD